MGILRTDKISGLETPTAVTGSVSFDGTGDNLTLAASTAFAWGTGDFTWEAWVYSTASDHTTGNHYMFDLGGGNIAAMSYYQDKFNYYNTTVGSTRQIGGFPANEWHHLAVARQSGTTYMFLDGVMESSFADTHDYGTSALAAEIAGYAGGSLYNWDGYISNLRVLKGTALYTANFTPPTHELEVIGDTVLLCCNNPDSAAAASYAGIGTSKTITVNGNAAASTFSPGLTRDFTFGTQFEGVTRFDTQGYFVPPSGTTEQRGRGRGIFWGGNNGANQNIIQFVQISTQGNASDFGDLTSATTGGASCASETRGLYGAGQNPGTTDTIEYITIATTSNAIDFGNLQVQRDFPSAFSSSTRGIFAGGRHPVPATYRNEIDYVTIASLGNAQDFGDLLAARQGMGGTSSPTRGLFAGGNTSPGSSDNVIQYITIATLGNAQDFGDLTQVTNSTPGAASSSIRGLLAGGYVPSPGAVTNVISYVTIATLGNAQDFGDLTDARRGLAGASNSSRGAFGGGLNPSTDVNTIDYVTIATTGDATDFGDLTHTNTRNIQGCSDSHGGIS